MIFLQLLLEFFKTGLFSVGGGLATLPFLKNIALRYSWFTPDDLINMIAVSESTPGPIGINCATYAGFQAAGILGSLAATFALVLPSFIIIIIISKMLSRFRQSTLVQDIFYGLRPASAGLIFGAVADIFLLALLHTANWNGPSSLLQTLNIPAILLFLAIFLAIKYLPKIHPIIFIAIGAVCGIFLPL